MEDNIMNNDEIRKAISAIRDAKKNISDALDKPGLTKKERKSLAELSRILEDFDNCLLLEDIRDSIDNLAKNSNEFKELISQKQEDLKKMEKVTASVNAVASAIDAVVKILNKVA